MSQEQPKRPDQQESPPKEPIKYGDVFPVFGELASKSISPQDAALMQTAEAAVLGQTQKGGPAAVMQSAAAINQRAGLVSHGDITDIAGDQGVTVTETIVPGTRIVTESIAGQVVGEFSVPTPVSAFSSAGDMKRSAITIGEALEATAITAADKAVDLSDAAAIQAAEARATGKKAAVPGGVAAEAQTFASVNARLERDEGKTKLGDVLVNACLKLAADKEVTKEDAEAVIAAEVRNNPEMATYPGGVAEAMVAAAKMNQQGGMSI